MIKNRHLDLELHINYETRKNNKVEANERKWFREEKEAK